jgi:2-octaprenyl-6-methoxyphenol hydroxylase
MNTFEITVVGGGLAGSVAALAFARKGFHTAFVAPEDGRIDARTSALMDNSVKFLETLGIWDLVAPHATALSTMQIVDATNRLLRAPTVAFRASEIDLPAFGYNIPNAAFLEVLNTALQSEPRLTRLPAQLTSMAVIGEAAELTLSTGETISSGLVVGADGRRSFVRQSAGIDARTHNYPQTGVVLNFAHDLPHKNISTEFHTETGPFTQVPLAGRRSSLVWVVKPEEAQPILDLDEATLNLKIEAKMQSMLGKVRVEGKPQAWPLSSMTAHHFGKGHVVLIGEAGHVFPPIGAQGLNLSLRDIPTAVDLAYDAKLRGASLAIGDAYDRQRRADVYTRTAGIDLMNRSLLSGFLPVQMLRAAGLQLLASVPPLRHLAMQEGVSPGRAFRNFPSFLRKKVDRQRA